MGAAAADRAKKPRAKGDVQRLRQRLGRLGRRLRSRPARRARAPKSHEPSNVVGEADALTINAKYAARFEHNKRREETQRLQEKVKREYILRPGDEDEDSDDESSSSESDEGDLPERFDEQFAKALVRIKRKDPEIYKPDVELFSDVSESSSRTNCFLLLRRRREGEEEEEDVQTSEEGDASRGDGASAPRGWRARVRGGRGRAREALRKVARGGTGGSQKTPSAAASVGCPSRIPTTIRIPTRTAAV